MIVPVTDGPDVIENTGLPRLSVTVLFVAVPSGVPSALVSRKLELTTRVTV